MIFLSFIREYDGFLNKDVFVSSNQEHIKNSFRLVQVCNALTVLNAKKRFCFLIVILSLVFVFSSGQPANANSTSINEKHANIWQPVLGSLAKDKGVYNANLRHSVRGALNLTLATGAAGLPLNELSSNLITRLKVLDKALSRYLRVSENTTNFEQLKRLMPALANIEERKLIEALLKSQSVKVPNLRNSRLLPFLDKRITRLANELIFNLKALVRERRDYEPALLKAMAQFGVKFSARPPDFILDYQLVDNGQNEQGDWLYQGYIALLGKYEIPVVSMEKSIVETAGSAEQAREQAMLKLADAVTKDLTQFLLNKMSNEKKG